MIFQNVDDFNYSKVGLNIVLFQKHEIWIGQGKNATNAFSKRKIYTKEIETHHQEKTFIQHIHTPVTN